MLLHTGRSFLGGGGGGGEDVTRLLPPRRPGFLFCCCCVMSGLLLWGQGETLGNREARSVKKRNAAVTHRRRHGSGRNRLGKQLPTAAVLSPRATRATKVRWWLVSVPRCVQQHPTHKRFVKNKKKTTAPPPGQLCRLDDAAHFDLNTQSTVCRTTPRTTAVV